MATGTSKETATAKILEGLLAGGVTTHHFLKYDGRNRRGQRQTGRKTFILQHPPLTPTRGSPTTGSSFTHQPQALGMDHCVSARTNSSWTDSF